MLRFRAKHFGGSSFGRSDIRIRARLLTANKVWCPRRRSLGRAAPLAKEFIPSLARSHRLLALTACLLSPLACSHRLLAIATCLLCGSPLLPFDHLLRSILSKMTNAPTEFSIRQGHLQGTTYETARYGLNCALKAVMALTRPSSASLSRSLVRAIFSMMSG